MKKLFFLLALTTLSHFSKSQSPCQFTKTVTGSTVTLNHMWALALIYTLDSVNIDFGDGSSVFYATPNIPFITNHTYSSPGNYNICLTRYISQIGVGTPIACTFCDSVTIAGSTGCTANADFTSSGVGGNYSFTNTSTCTGCTSQTYVWTFGDGGAPSTQTNPTRVYTSSGTKNVCLIMYGQNNGVACVDTTCKTINVVLSSVDDVVKNVLNLYPNPTQQSISIELPEGEKTTQAMIMDATGRIVLQQNINTTEKKIQLNVEALSKGIYMLKLSTDKRSYINQFIKN